MSEITVIEENIQSIIINKGTGAGGSDFEAFEMLKGVIINNSL
jgi:hypothetical protein